MKLRCFITEPTLTSPVLPHSGQQCSSRAPPWTSASAGSANHPRSGWREELHHRTANPGQGEEAKRELTSSAQFLGNQNKRSVSAAPTEKCCGVRPTEGGREESRFSFCSTSLDIWKFEGFSLLQAQWKQKKNQFVQGYRLWLWCDFLSRIVSEQ